MGFWKEEAVNRHYFYFDDQCHRNYQTWNMNLIKCKGHDDNFYYCVTAYIKGNSRTFEIDASTVKSVEEAQEIAEKWLDEKYAEFINELKENLAFAEKRREELRKSFK